METTDLIDTPKGHGRNELLTRTPPTLPLTVPHDPRPREYTNNTNNTLTWDHSHVYPTSPSTKASTSTLKSTATTTGPSSSSSSLPAETADPFQYVSSNFDLGSTLSTSVDKEDDIAENHDYRPTAKKTFPKSTAGSSSSRLFRSIVYKFGRAFNRNYFLPHDKQEQERNNLQHEISIDVHDGALHICPVENPKRVLDVGTGTGIWAVEFAKRHPDCYVLGTDLNPVPDPPSTIHNCHFIIADADEEWKLGSPFDLIHVRSLGEPTDKRRLFKSIYDNLAPGGWVEFQEWLLHVQSSDRSLEGTAFQRWNQFLAEGLQKLGRSLFYILDYKALLEQTGFQNVVELKYAVPTNTWAPGRQYQRIGARQRTNTLEVIDIYSRSVLTQGLGWSDQAVDKLLAEARKDIDNTRIHSFSTLMTIYCQKPLSASTRSPNAEKPPHRW
ncbi:S-adenosyl-L-methionine-dependent methyltransferase [Daldinia caldariorum]|uniref:S-adenosyl-L-methionine-dependent methyltransferase n=1 Tax=Daldinia caldariorum TaxID=326644 RepID=UPI0020083539|nr:S-adenosyl-L-methionine-dependent methyltransferase [Daldinia caldariorum]KAI1472218.1 S-adenosyl-L-methionine-dependent methyltransferase [Daldinia caldariorum]